MKQIDYCIKCKFFKQMWIHDAMWGWRYKCLNGKYDSLFVYQINEMQILCNPN